MNRVKHIAFFQFKPDCSPSDIAAVWQCMEKLPTLIPGILDFTWGENISTEGLSQNFTHSFVMLFENEAARDAYLPHPAHQAAVEFVLPKLASVIVCDHACPPI
ncbi:MAG: Dabb family protein [Verrucomicrobiota bacterium]